MYERYIKLLAMCSNQGKKLLSCQLVLKRFYNRGVYLMQTKNDITIRPLSSARD